MLFRSDTRKTTPGLRILEKYATYIGGAKKHRVNRAERFMIKDNHLLLNSKIFEKIRKMKISKKNTIVMECDNLYQVKKAILLKIDRKSTRLNSSHALISYAVFCLKKKKKTKTI